MTNSDYIPFKITGVITGAVGTPSNDGTRGSGLYAVPFSVSRALTDAEQTALVETWDSPPAFTTMHRRGIARCYSDKFVLASTTIEEVRDYHMKTLNAVVEQVNQMSEEAHRQAAQVEAEQKAREEAHRKNIEDVAKGLNSAL